MMLIGLEKEFFLVDPDGVPVALTQELQTLPADECGWLVEARGKPFSSIIEAVYSLQASAKQAELQLNKINMARQGAGKSILRMVDTPILRVPRAVQVEAQRIHNKPPIKYRNFYGYEYHNNKAGEATAGVHISFTEQRTFRHNERSETYNINFDWPSIFVAMDQAFKLEIRQAKRRPGFYELKSDGRVEYRSLPANVNLDRVIDVMQKLLAA